MDELLESAINNERSKDFSFYMDGDLSQMANQRIFLNNHGIATKQNNVYPCIQSADVPRAMYLIWNNKADGWWHYKDEYVKHGICTEEEFTTYLKRS